MKKYTIREVREKILKISQEELAHKLGKTTANWNRKENYKRVLKADELIGLAKLAKLDPRQIVIKE